MSGTRVERVVVGISGSLGNLAALHAAVGQAQRSGAQLVAVLAWSPAGGELTYRRSPCAPLLEQWRQQAEDTLLNAFADAFGGPPPGVAMRSIIARGFAGSILVEEASQPGDLLVVGAGRRGRIARLRRGSVKRHCLAHARCPVLTVPQPDLMSELGAGNRAWRKREALRPVEIEQGGPFSERTV